MNKICKASCSPYLEKQRCKRSSEQLRLPQITVNDRKWILDAEKKNDLHYKFQCNQEERRRRAQAKHRKLIQKLKFEYRINVDQLSSQVLEDIIFQTEALEKQKQIREKNKIQRRLSFISKLVQEEKYKCRGMKSRPPLGKKFHKIRQPDISETKIEETDDSNLLLYPPEAEENGDSEGGITAPERESGTTVTEEIESDQSECDQKPSQESLLKPGFFSLPGKESFRPSSEVDETHLKCTPVVILFDNCEPNKAYIQTYRITNVGLDVVHCRCAGIEAKSSRVALRVEMTDNVLLRPGLSFSGKIKLLPSVEPTEFNSFLIYETRRKNNPNKKACFRIPVKCLPAGSIVEVLSKIIRFPTVSWCEATGEERSKDLRKSIKIKNTGAKDCFCAIVNAEHLKESSGSSEIWLGEEESVQTVLPLHSHDEESLGEGHYFPGTYEEALTILSELLDNVFEVFRFSRKYHIVIPAMSVVKVDVDFLPKYKGYHHEIVFIRFEGASNCTEEKLELTGDIKKVPLRVEPSTIDLKICIINSGIYEGTFRIHNDSNRPFPIRLKVPGSMKEHSLVFPKHPVVQPRSYQICSVRLFPGESISNDAFRYYKEDTKVLEFPVFIQPVCQNACKWDRIKLYVFAVLTNYALELQPHEINFGVVTTLETIRTEISLTNHSMCLQEFGFIHLPKGVRIEPNYGFGVILPKETIKLYLLYSPVLSYKNNPTEEGSYNFCIEVTSLAKLCSFTQRVQEPLENESTDTPWGEELIYNTEVDETPQGILSQKDSSADDEDDDEEEEESLSDNGMDGILANKQRKIRDYLKQNIDSFSSASSTETMIEEQSTPVFLGENGELSTRSSPRNDKHVITCKAFVLKPFCELSSTVIQLPATPLSSMSITRFRINTNAPEKCDCKFLGKWVKKNDRSFFEAFFEFHTSSPWITIEPQTGHIIRGQSVPVAIIFKPELSKSDLAYQSKVFSTESFSDGAKSKNNASSPQKSKSKTKTAKPIGQASRNEKVEIESQDVNLSNVDVTNYDLYARERALQQIIDPFHLEIKVICVMKILPCQNAPERVESHRLIIIAPVIKPSCIFLGSCQEITFGKVAVGDKSRKIIQIQNISLSRISPRATALNPHGPFTYTTGSELEEVDPEHIWRHPITFSPTAERGKEIEFFEVRHGATSIPLTVNGTGVIPKYAFSPDFAFCVLETSIDVIADVEFFVENLCEAALKFQFVTDFIKQSSSFEDDSATLETSGSRKSDVTLKKPEKRANQTTKDGRKRISLKNELVPEVASQLETQFRNVSNPPRDLFTIAGLNENNEVALSPFEKCALKIKFCLNKNGENSSSPSAYAIGYKLMVARKLVKNLTIIAIIHSDKEHTNEK